MAEAASEVVGRLLPGLGDGRLDLTEKLPAEVGRQL
jgi:hypothetical protein